MKRSSQDLGDAPTAEHVTGDGGASRRRVFFVSAGLVLAVIAVYAQVRHHSFVSFDDLAYIVDNPHVRSGPSWEGLRWALTHAYLSNWHPLTWLSHMLDWRLFGSNPAGPHLVNVALHAANAVVLFLALRALTGSLGRSAVVAALFALHPLRVESVAWAAERKDVLAGLFWMIALLAWASYARRPSVARYLLVAGSLTLGLMAKPMLVTLPCVLLLLDVWPLERLRPTGLRALAWPIVEKLPLAALAAGASAVTVASQSAGGAFHPISLADRMANAALAYVGYLWKSIWPAGLSVFYPHPADVDPGGATAWRWLALGAAVVLVLATAGALAQFRRRPWLLVGWLWYLGTLVPVIGLAQVGRQAAADRYTYLPTIGIAIAVVWTCADLARRWSWGPALARGVALVVLLLLAAASYRQVGHWRTSELLFEHALATTRSNYVAHNNLGSLLLERGDFARAAPHFARAIEIRPDFADGHANLGALWLLQGRDDLAWPALEQALRVQPSHVQARYNLGRGLIARGDLAGAEVQLATVLRLAPEHVEARTNLGAVYARLGQAERAEAEFRRALALRPDHAAALQNLARLLELRGATAEAAALRERALRRGAK